MPSLVLPMFLFALAGAISPGPVNLVAASLGASAGFYRALPHVAGASLSYAAIVWLMGSGFQGVLLAYPWASQWTQYAGAAYLLYLSARIAMAPALQQAGPAGAAPDWLRGLVLGIGAQTLNPKAWLVALSGVSLFVGAGPQASASLWLFCGISGGVCFGAVAAWAALGRWIRRWLAHPPYQVLFNRCMALALALSVASMLMP